MATIECNDGWSVSVVAGSSVYCDPRENGVAYKSVELGYPSEADSLITPYAEDRSRPTNTVYGWVPSYVLLHLFEKHGGVKAGNLPKLDLESADVVAEHAEWMLKNPEVS